MFCDELLDTVHRFDMCLQLVCQVGEICIVSLQIIAESMEVIMSVSINLAQNVARYKCVLPTASSTPDVTFSEV